MRRLEELHKFLFGWQFTNSSTPCARARRVISSVRGFVVGMAVVWKVLAWLHLFYCTLVYYMASVQGSGGGMER